MIRSGCAVWVFVLLAIIICLSIGGCSPKHEHTEVVDAAVAATCTEAGKTEGKHCSVCNTVLVAQQSVPALGTASLCKLHGTLGDHDCILENAKFSTWNNYGVFRDTEYNRSMN